MNRPLVLFTDETDLNPDPGRMLLEGAGCETVLADLPSEPGAEQVLPDGAERAVALVVGYARIDKDLLDRLPGVGCIATMSAGVDMVDLAEAERRGIWVVNLVSAATEEVAAHALTLILAVERHLRASLEVTASGGWTPEVQPVPRRLSELTLGLYGFGRIARRLAEIAAPTFERVITHDPYIAETPGHVEPVDPEVLLQQSDVLSLHLPLTPDTEGMIGSRALESMRKGSTLVNVSRGELVDFGALGEALDSGQLVGAGLDVLAGEPPAADDPFRHDPRVVVTPHVAFLSDGSLAHYVLDPARHVLQWLRTGSIEGAVTAGTVSEPLLGATPERGTM